MGYLSGSLSLLLNREVSNHPNIEAFRLRRVDDLRILRNHARVGGRRTSMFGFSFLVDVMLYTDLWTLDEEAFLLFDKWYEVACTATENEELHGLRHEMTMANWWFTHLRANS